MNQTFNGRIIRYKACASSTIVQLEVQRVDHSTVELCVDHVKLENLAGLMFSNHRTGTFETETRNGQEWLVGLVVRVEVIW